MKYQKRIAKHETERRVCVIAACKTVPRPSSGKTAARRCDIESCITSRRRRCRAVERDHRRRIRRLLLLPHADIPRIFYHAMERDHFAAGVDGEDGPAFNAFDAFAEEPGLHEGVADEVEVASELEGPVPAVVGAQLFVM